MAGWLRIARNMFLFLLGIIGMVAGTIYSVKDIVEYFVGQNDDESFPKCDVTIVTNATVAPISTAVMNSFL